MLEAFRRTWPDCLREVPHFSDIVTAALIVLIENGLMLMHMRQPDLRLFVLFSLRFRKVILAWFRGFDFWAKLPILVL